MHAYYIMKAFKKVMLSIEQLLIYIWKHLELFTRSSYRFLIWVVDKNYRSNLDISMDAYYIMEAFKKVMLSIEQLLTYIWKHLELFTRSSCRYLIWQVHTE